jgi:hypothetical protein
MRVAPFASVKSVSAHMVLQTIGTCGRGNGINWSSACSGCGFSSPQMAIDDSDDQTAGIEDVRRSAAARSRARESARRPCRSEQRCATSWCLEAILRRHNVEPVRAPEILDDRREKSTRWR